jgi:Na+-transporting methylmalonyl-CoA/oxaloacetate decarboxylase gamma subunit
MVSHIIVFTVLSILSAIAIHAFGKPISKSLPAPKAPGPDKSHSVVTETSHRP